MIQIRISIGERLLERIDIQASEREMSRSALIRDILHWHFVKGIPGPSKRKRTKKQPEQNAPAASTQN